MFLDGNPVFDYDLETLREIALVLDARLDKLDRDIERYEDADAFGDTAEGLCGIGFVAGQQYMTATASWLGVDKSKALPCGPIHKCGDTVASIINHAANYWKHGDEWRLGKSEKQQATTGADNRGSSTWSQTQRWQIMKQVMWNCCFSVGEHVHESGTVAGSLRESSASLQEARRRQGLAHEDTGRRAVNPRADGVSFISVASNASVIL